VPASTGSLTLDKLGVYPIVGMLSSHHGRNAQPMLEGFPLVMRFTVPFSDCDMLQHVNNVAYIRWCETVRTEFFARVMGEDITSERGMIQANINFNYERQIEYRESIVIGVRVSRFGAKSLDFEYEIWSLTHDRRAARGTTTVVAFDFVNGKTIAVPQAWRDAVAAFEAGPQHSFI
jgi:acyl-CoA thioester hydrolase